MLNCRKKLQPLCKFVLEWCLVIGYIVKENLKNRLPLKRKSEDKFLTNHLKRKQILPSIISETGIVCYKRCTENNRCNKDFLFFATETRISKIE